MANSRVPPIAVTIAGSDSSGGAGIQADLKTFAALEVYSASVITALTAQNTLGVFAVRDVPPDFVRAQIDAVFEDLSPRATKLGMLSRVETIRAVAEGQPDAEWVRDVFASVCNVGWCVVVGIVEQQRRR